MTKNFGACHSPVDFRAHSCSLSHVLMHKYLRENDKSQNFCIVCMGKGEFHNNTPLTNSIEDAQVIDVLVVQNV